MSKMLAANFQPRELGQATGENLPEWLPQSPFQSELFEPRTVAALAKRYEDSQPYRHIHIRNLGDPEAMRKVRHEILNHMTTTYRETDLFKVSQTMDLNNVALNDEAAQKTPYLMALRTHMYSESFRNFLENVTGCGKLSDRVDCAANLYTSGSHLLCHDDVITTRKLSYIIYLSLAPESEGATAKEGEAEGPWKPEYGGALELFDSVPARALPPNTEASAHCASNDSQMLARACGSVSSCDMTSSSDQQDTSVSLNSEAFTKGIVRVPLTVPGAVLQPEFNSMVVFEVKAGASFHAVQEVMTYNAKRISIQGWFHFAGPRPKHYDHGATLRLLQAPMIPLDVAAVKEIEEEKEAAAAAAAAPETPQAVVVYPGSIHKSPAADLPDSVRLKLLQDMEDEPESKVYVDYSQVVLNFLEEDEATKRRKLEEDDEDDEDELSRTIKMFLSWTLKSAREAEGGSSDSTNGEDDAAESKMADGETNEDEETDVWNDPEVIRKDLAFLRKFINRSYTSVPVLQSIQRRFRRTGLLHLTSFLRPKLFYRLLQFIIKADLDEGLALAPNPDHEDFKVEDEDDGEEGENETKGSSSSVSRYLPKPKYPPDYLTGINSFTADHFGGTTTDDKVPSGTWRLAGPPFKKRLAVFQSPDAQLVADFLRKYATKGKNPDEVDAAMIFRNATASQRAGLALDALNRALFQSTAFARLIQWLTCRTPLTQASAVKRFRPGLDYTVGSYDRVVDPNAEGTVLDVSYTIVDEGQLDFSPFLWKSSKYNGKTEDGEPVASAWEPYEDANAEWSLIDDNEQNKEDDSEEDDEDPDVDEEDDPEMNAGKTKVWLAENRIARRAALLSQKRSKKRLWRSDDHGGFNAHVPVDRTTEGDQAEEYVEGQGELVSLSARANALSIVHKRPYTLTFVRYVNAGAPGSRWEIRSEVHCLENSDTQMAEDTQDGEEDAEEDGFFAIDEDEDFFAEWAEEDADLDPQEKLLRDAMYERGGYETQDESTD